MSVYYRGLHSPSKFTVKVPIRALPPPTLVTLVCPALNVPLSLFHSSSMIVSSSFGWMDGNSAPFRIHHMPRSHRSRESRRAFEKPSFNENLIDPRLRGSTTSYIRAIENMYAIASLISATFQCREKRKKGETNENNCAWNHSIDSRSFDWIYQVE